MIDAFIENIPFDAEENKFLLVNTLFKRIKQLTQKNNNLISPLTSDEIVQRAYTEVKDGKVKPILQEKAAEEKPKARKRLKEIVLTEKPLKAKGGKKVKAKKTVKAKGKK